MYGSGPGGAAVGILVAGLLFLILLALPGMAVLRLLVDMPARARHLGLATGVGFATVMPLVLAEHWLGGPYLVLPAVLLSLAVVRRDLAHWLEGLRAADVLVPVLLAAIALAVSVGDLRLDPAGLTVRAGFDVLDRVFYALVAQEVQRSLPAQAENPLFAGVPFPYSFFPSLAGSMLHRYGGLPLLPLFMVVLPCLSMVFLAVIAQELVRELGFGGRAAAITAALLALGGDLSPFFRPQGVTGLERTRHFLLFHSFSAESLYYNTWMLGLPLALVALALGLRWLASGGRGTFVLAAWVTAALWQTKVFALIPLLGGMVLAGVVGRKPRLLALTGASGVLVLAWVALLTPPEVWAGASLPLAVRPLYPVAVSMEANAHTAPIARLLAEGQPPAWRVGAWLAALALFVIGGLGVRVLGIGAAGRAALHDRTGFHAWLVASLAVAFVLGVSLVGQPVVLDGIQFLLLAYSLLWLYTGPVLGELLVAAQPLRRLAAATLMALAVLAPFRYLAQKADPQRFTTPGSLDRAVLRLPSPALRACRWLESHSAPQESLLVPLGPGSEAAPALVSAVCGRRLVAAPNALSVAASVAEHRLSMADRFYATFDAADGERLLRELGARWVWVDGDRSLGFSSPRLVLRFVTREVRIFEFRPEAEAGLGYHSAAER